nr:hypothetical protein GCM10017745_01350 [Saccharothrix mutabilis subsp. capreolus]
MAKARPERIDPNWPEPPADGKYAVSELASDVQGPCPRSARSPSRSRWKTWATTTRPPRSTAEAPAANRSGTPRTARVSRRPPAPGRARAAFPARGVSRAERVEPQEFR